MTSESKSYAVKTQQFVALLVAALSLTALAVWITTNATGAVESFRGPTAAQSQPARTLGVVVGRMKCAQPSLSPEADQSSELIVRAPIATGRVYKRHVRVESDVYEAHREGSIVPLVYRGNEMHPDFDFDKGRDLKRSLVRIKQDTRKFAHLPHDDRVFKAITLEANRGGYRPGSSVEAEED